MKAGVFRRVPAFHGLYPKSKPPAMRVVLIREVVVLYKTQSGRLREARRNGAAPADIVKRPAPWMDRCRVDYG